MPYVITHTCCKDGSCVPVCPVDCIRPVDDDGQIAASDMLYIDPATCIDCGACMEECPVDAIYPDDGLPWNLARFTEVNAAYFDRHPLRPSPATPQPPRTAIAGDTIRVAIVGAGPAACYAATELISVPAVQVTMFERLPTPFGLVRAGVAPDHQQTKGIVRVFEPALASNRVRCFFDVEVGAIVSHGELMAHHNAVIYAVGAGQGRRLGIPGEHLTGVHTAADFVGWYNAHPDHSEADVDLSGARAVIIGNGNVALDIARVLLMNPEDLLHTDVSDNTLAARNASSIEEVIIIGRRNFGDAAFSLGEFAALGDLDDVEIIIDGDLPRIEPGDDLDQSQKLALAREYQSRTTSPGRKRIVFRFNLVPTEVVGDVAADGLRLRREDGTEETIDASLLIASIGYQSRPVPGVPFDPQHGVIPHYDGRVVDEEGVVLPGVYVTGWAKRGARGVIGTNRTCSAETVNQLLNDVETGSLPSRVVDIAELERLLHARGAAPLSYRDWGTIDLAERTQGRQQSRPRIKLSTRAEMLAAVRRTPLPSQPERSGI